jgi:hypothetical protein
MNQFAVTQSRHCKRSEAIHLTAQRKYGSLRHFAPRDNGGAASDAIAFSLNNHSENCIGSKSNLLEPAFSRTRLMSDG